MVVMPLVEEQLTEEAEEVVPLVLGMPVVVTLMRLNLKVAVEVVLKKLVLVVGLREAVVVV